MKFLRGILVDEEQFKEFVREVFVEDILGRVESRSRGNLSKRLSEKFLKEK